MINRKAASKNKDKSNIKTYRQNQLNQFIDMINTYKTNFPYLLFNCKTFIENSLKGLNLELLTQKNAYDIDYAITFLKDKNILTDSIISQILTLTGFIRRIESGKLEPSAENTKQVLIETATIIIHILYLEQTMEYKNGDGASKVYLDKLNKNKQNHLQQIIELIQNNIQTTEEENILQIIGPVYFYSNGEVSISKHKRAVFIDLENVTIISKPKEEEFLRRDGGKEQVSQLKVVTSSGKQISIYVWRRWKEFIPMMKPGEKLSLLNVAVKHFPDFKKGHLLEKSLLIIKPDYLINATTIAKVIQNRGHCLNKYLLDLKKRNITDSIHALRGIMIGEIIDDYVLDGKNFNFKDSFEKHYKSKLHKVPFIKNAISPQQLYRQIASQMYVIDNFIWNDDNPKFKPPQYIEPFYISPMYGMEGRMDMMYLDKEKEVLRVYELKSGKAPSANYPPWENHSYQTYSYKMILDSVYNYEDSKSYLLYSSSENPIRRLSYDLTIETIVTRNRVIAFIEKLIDENTSREDFLQIHKEEMCMNCPNYLKSECISDFDLFTKELNKDELDYYISFFKLLEREKILPRIQTSYLWKKTLSEREQMFTALSGLSIEEVNDNIIIFRISSENNSDIRAGDNVLIHRGNPVKDELFRGSVIQIKKNTIIVNLYKSMPRGMMVDGWCIDRAYTTSSIDAQHAGLYRFIKSQNRFKDLILGKVKPEFKKRVYRKPDIDESFNDNQKKAFDLCMKAKDYALIQGPPGTGKTYTIAGVIKQFAEEGKKVLVTGYTNRAVDNILITLKEKFGYDNYIRIGSKYNIDPQVIPYSADEIVKKYDINESEKLKDEILSKNVFASTTTSAMSTLIFDNIKFDVVIVDEAGQMTEPATLTVITFADKFLLFGDDKQLPPIVTYEIGYNPFIENDYLTSIGLSKLSKSLFERLWKMNKSWESEETDFQSTLTLNIQYRMNESIAGISDRFFYGNIIKSDIKNKNHTINDLDYQSKDDAPNLKELLDGDNPICMVDCMNERASKENETEANLVYLLTEQFLKGGLNPNQIGIIAPYKAQCALIRKKLDSLPIVGKKPSEIIVDTVERYQGGEKELIIVSFTVGDESMMKFLSEDNDNPNLNRKLNVSITRAKRKIILIGNSRVLMTDPSYRQILLHLDSKGLTYRWKLT
jgi:DNA replication ATP-dependent helicase Dna2